jgi:hypothetical protein
MFGEDNKFVEVVSPFNVLTPLGSGLSVSWTLVRVISLMLGSWGSKGDAKR